MNSDSPLVFSNPPLDVSLLPAPVPWIWIISSAVTLIFIGIVLIAIRFRTRPAFSDTNRHDAYQTAMAALDAASALSVREAATEASLAIRRYLCAVAQDPSLFETHEEFLTRHPSISHWPSSTLDALGRVLKELAEIKYRPATDTTSDASQLLTASRQLLHALEQDTTAA